MNSTRKGAASAIAVVLLLVVGLGTALAAGGPGRGGAPGFGMHAGAGPGYGVMAGGVVMDAAAEYIGISEAALAAERHDGKSLAQVATAHGKSVTGLEAALVTAFEANLDKAVGAGRITQAQATQILAGFKAHASTMVQRTAVGPAGMRGGGHCRWSP